MSLERGGRIAVFGDGGHPTSAAPTTAPIQSPTKQDPFAMPSEQELVRCIIESTREVDERSAQVSDMLKDLASPGAGRDGPATVRAESDIHAAYTRLADARLAQRRAAVRLWRARNDAGAR